LQVKLPQHLNDVYIFLPRLEHRISAMRAKIFGIQILAGEKIPVLGEAAGGRPDFCVWAGYGRGVGGI
jgi:hypothetical protein